MSEPGDPGDGLLAGQVVVVVGAASGIGRACAQAAAGDGAEVVLADRDPAGLRETARLLPSPGQAPLEKPTDVTDEDQWHELMSAATGRYGRVDGLVLAAGIARHVPLEKMTLAQWEEMLAVHLTGAFLGLRAAARTMTGCGGGSVVYVASTVTAGRGPLHQSHYVAAKAGALGLVRAAARELGPHGIRVNAVSPGFTRTPLNSGLFTAEEINARALAAPLGTVAEPADVADTATFLLSDRSRLTTGQDLRVDAGATMG